MSTFPVVELEDSEDLSFLKYNALKWESDKSLAPLASLMAEIDVCAQ